LVLLERAIGLALRRRIGEEAAQRIVVGDDVAEGGDPVAGAA
jgi:hypothetical protein